MTYYLVQQTGQGYPAQQLSTVSAPITLASAQQAFIGQQAGACYAQVRPTMCIAQGQSNCNMAMSNCSCCMPTVVVPATAVPAATARITLPVFQQTPTLPPSTPPPSLPQPQPQISVASTTSTSSAKTEITCEISKRRPPLGVYRKRLMNMYQKYDPEMLGSVDVMLAQHIGKEDELMRKMITRYGPEPIVAQLSNTQTTIQCAAPAPPPPPPQPDRSKDMELLFKRMEELMTKCTEKVLKVTSPPPPPPAPPVVEEEIVPVVIQITPPVDYSRLLTRYFTYYAPERLSSISSLLHEFRGRETELIDTLVVSYGPEPTDIRLIEGHKSSKRVTHTSVVSHVVESTAVTVEVEEKVESVPIIVRVCLPSTEDSSQFCESSVLDDMITQLVLTHEPSALAMIPQLIELYGGNREALYDSLQSRYYGHQSQAYTTQTHSSEVYTNYYSAR